MAIPKIIYQTLPDKNIIQDVLVKNIEYIRDLNRDWEYRLYDNADIELFILENYDRSVLDVYHRINPSYGPARADFFRYLAVYALGGVYLDIKSSLTKRLNNVILEGDSYILSQWDNKKGEPFEDWGLHPDPGMPPGGEYQNWHIISAPRHPILGAVISAVTDNIRSYTPKLFGVGKMGVLRTTGPIAYSQAVERIKNTMPHRGVKNADFGLCYSIFASAPKAGAAYHKAFGRNYINLNEQVVFDNYLSEGGKLDSNFCSVSRNDKCPCGSGKRFKHCHGALA